MSYRQDVAEAKRLQKRSEDDQWRLAELTWNNVRPQGEATQRQWAEDIGVTHRTVGRMAQVWGKFGARVPQDRPGFWDAHAQIVTGDPEATTDSRRKEHTVRTASPALIAKVVAESPDLQRAIARNAAAFEGIEDEAITVRAEAPFTAAEVSRTTHRNLSKALGADQVVEYLHGAAREIGNAIYCSERWGVEDAEAEAEALRAIKRLLAVYEGRAEWTEKDEELLSSIGSRLPNPKER